MYKHLHCPPTVLLSMHAEKSLYSELLSKARAIDLAFIVSLA